MSSLEISDSDPESWFWYHEALNRQMSFMGFATKGIEDAVQEAKEVLWLEEAHGAMLGELFGGAELAEEVSTENQLPYLAL